MHLQPGAVDDLVVNGHLQAIIVDDKDADAATAVVERLGEAAKQTTLVKDGKALLDITTLGHGDDATILTDVKNTVLLEDRTKHVLDNNGRSRVGDERRLLMELLGEEVNTEVAVLASLGGGGDADDLARAALKDQEIANADVVAGDGDGVGGRHLACGGWGGRLSGVSGLVVDTDDAFNRDSGLDGAGGRSSRDGSSVLLLYDDVLAAVLVLGSLVGVLVRIVLVVVRVDGVRDTFSDLVGGFVDTLTERVVLTFVVVISHITLVLLGGLDGGTSRLFYSNLSSWIAAVNSALDLSGRRASVVLGRVSLPGVAGGLLVVGVGAEVGVTSFSDDGTGALAELTLRDVDLGGRVVGSRAVDGVEVAVVGPVLYLDGGVGVRVGRGRLVAVTGNFEFNVLLALNLLRLPVAGLLADVNFFAVLGTAEALLFSDADLLLDVGVAVLGRGLRRGLGRGRADGGCEGFVDFFVTFPSV